MYGTIIGFTKGDTRSLDYGSHEIALLLRDDGKKLRV